MIIQSICNLTYAEALADNPAVVAVVLKKIRKGRSKKKNDAPETFEWSYGLALLVNGLSLMDRLAGKKEYDADFTDAQKVADYVSRCTTWLQANGHSCPIPVPDFVGEEKARQLIQEGDERRRFEALSVEDQQAEIAKLMSAAIAGGARVVLVPERPHGE